MSLSFLFYLTATIAVASAIFVVLIRNAIYSPILLVLCFFALAVLYLLLEAYFLAVLEVFIYAGAIMVLFLFVIMLLNLGREKALEHFMYLQRGLSIFLVVLFFPVRQRVCHIPLGVYSVSPTYPLTILIQANTSVADMSCLFMIVFILYPLFISANT